MDAFEVARLPAVANEGPAVGVLDFRGRAADPRTADRRAPCTPEACHLEHGLRKRDVEDWSHWRTLGHVGTLPVIPHGVNFFLWKRTTVD